MLDFWPSRLELIPMIPIQNYSEAEFRGHLGLSDKFMFGISTHLTIRLQNNKSLSLIWTTLMDIWWSKPKILKQVWRNYSEMLQCIKLCNLLIEIPNWEAPQMNLQSAHFSSMSRQFITRIGFPRGRIGRQAASAFSSLLVHQKVQLYPFRSHDDQGARASREIVMINWRYNMNTK